MFGMHTPLYLNPPTYLDVKVERMVYCRDLVYVFRASTLVLGTDYSSDDSSEILLFTCPSGRN